MSIHNIGQSRWRIVVKIKGYRKDFKLRGTEQEALAFEAKKFLEIQAQLAASGNASEEHPRTAPLFSDFCAGRYRQYAEAQLAASTWRNRQYQLKALLEVIGDKPLDKIGIADVERYQAAKRKAKIGAVKINDDIKGLLAVLNYAHDVIGFPAKVPAFKKLPERGAKKRVQVYTEDEVKTLYEALGRECPHLLGPTVAMINAGLRKGEALALEWSWVDLKRDMLVVQPNEFWQPKDNEPREIPIGAALRPWLEGERQHPRYVFPTLATRKHPQGQRYTCWPQNQWDSARDAAKVGGSPHVCRHTFASHFLAKCPDLWLLAKVLGHSHTRVTELYTHLLPGHLEKARDVVRIGVSLKALNTATRARKAGR